MAGELDNMKRMARVVVNRIDFAPNRNIFEVHYSVRSEDGTVLNTNATSADLSTTEGIENYNLDQISKWATKEAAKHAKKQYGQ